MQSGTPRPHNEARGLPVGSGVERATPRDVSDVVEAASEAAPKNRLAGGIRVLCVDDHKVLVDGLQVQFGIDGTIRVVGCLPSAEQLIDEAVRLNPDVVLLDVEMPGPDAFEIADRLQRMLPNVRVIFLSAHVRDVYIAAAYKCGASGYFSKADDLKAIGAGIREVAKNRGNEAGVCEFVMGPKVRERCLTPRPVSRFSRSKAGSPEGGSPSTPLGELSDRELEVLRLIGKGKSRNDIARELSRSVKTVDGHQDRIMKKLGIQTRAELMRFAIREGLAEA